MAGDTRDGPSPRSPPPGATAPPPHIQSATPKVYELFNAPPPPSSSETNSPLPPGAGQNTAGAHTPAPTLINGLSTVRLGDFKQVYMYPCVRDGLMFGLVGGFAMGGVRGIMGASVMKTCNWAIGTFCLTGAGSYEFCLQRRRLERNNMLRAVEIIDRKKAEKEAEARAKREQRRKARDEAERAKKSSWKFW